MMKSRKNIFRNVHAYFDGHYECLDHILASDHIHPKNPNAIGKLVYLQYFTDHLIDHSQRHLSPRASDQNRVVAHIQLY